MRDLAICWPKDVCLDRRGLESLAGVPTPLDAFQHGQARLVRRQVLRPAIDGPSAQKQFGGLPRVGDDDRRSTRGVYRNRNRLIELFIHHTHSTKTATQRSRIGKVA